MTLSQMAADAIQVQDACNLSGVVQSYARVMLELGNHTNGTDERNHHPIAILFASKVGHLTGIGEGDTKVVSDAWDVCSQLARS